MRILLVHNYYGSAAPSGENEVFEAERAMLERHGETVAVFTRHSDEIRGKGVLGLLRGALCTMGNPFAARALKRKIRDFRPDVVHFHNQFPLISPLAIRAAHECGVRVVMTLHNYRLVCAAGIPRRNGCVCTECFLRGPSGETGGHGKSRLSVWPAVKYRCYRKGLLATLPLAANLWLYRKHWEKWVDAFVVLSDFQRNVMISCGFPSAKLIVKGNFIATQSESPERSHLGSRSGAVFVGRLSDAKGVKTLIAAWRLLVSQHAAPVPLLTLIGDGGRRAEYESLARGLPIRFLGQVDHDAVVQEMAHAKCLVLPSECWETFGLVVVEAALVGTPAVVSDLGALPDVVGDTGGVVKAGDAKRLAEGIRAMLVREDYEALSEAARTRARELYSEEANYRRIMAIYRG